MSWPMRRTGEFVLALLVILAVSGCLLDRSAPLTGDILVIGDSVLWWNSEEDASVADVLTTRLGLEVANASVPGALFLGPQGESIQDQYVPGDWAWLVMDGGANDLGEGCGCGDCLAAVDPLISPDATSGAIPAFVQRIVEDGPRLVIMGYYDPPDAGGEFSGCQEELAALNDRLWLLSERLSGVFFAPAAQVIEPGNRAHYDEDLVHPSVLGSRLIGDQIAAMILAAP
ncbi:MAG: SGNH/GDSL hydrolase family protein [Flavimaricola sp.]|nr:SGNH/GDSL hydrolase family protein [Flavimaricola sp.]